MPPHPAREPMPREPVRMTASAGRKNLRRRRGTKPRTSRAAKICAALRVLKCLGLRGLDGRDAFAIGPEEMALGPVVDTVS